VMFGLGVKGVKTGDYIFGTIYEGEYSTIIIGFVEFRHENRLKIKGIHLKPVGLLEKSKRGNISPRLREVLKSPTSNNVIHILLDKVDTTEIEDYIDINQFQSIERINIKRFSEIDYWVKEGLPELFSLILSGDSKSNEMKQILINKMNSIPDADIKRTIYAIARQLRIL